MREHEINRPSTHAHTSRPSQRARSKTALSLERVESEAADREFRRSAERTFKALLDNTYTTLWLPRV
jgi:hypothetical protein